MDSTGSSIQWTRPLINLGELYGIMDLSLDTLGLQSIAPIDRRRRLRHFFTRNLRVYNIFHPVGESSYEIFYPLP